MLIPYSIDTISLIIINKPIILVIKKLITMIWGKGDNAHEPESMQRCHWKKVYSFIFVMRLWCQLAEISAA